MISSKTIKNMLLDAGVVYVNYGLANERILGATAGGNKFIIDREYRDVEVDGAKGKTKGLKRLLSENASLEVNLKEMSTENIMLALPGTTKSDYTSLAADAGVTVKGAIAAGATTVVFDGTNLAGTLKKGDVFSVAGAAGTYTVSEDASIVTGEITVKFSPAAPVGGFADDSIVTITAQYDKIISLGQISDTDYLENIAFLTTVSGSQRPCVIVLYNALNDDKLEMATKDKDEVVVGLKISAHYDPAALTSPIYEIRYPKIA